MPKVMKMNQSKIVDELEDDEDDVEGAAIDDADEVEGKSRRVIKDLEDQKGERHNEIRGCRSRG